jgi:hypothetical protein
VGYQKVEELSVEKTVWVSFYNDIGGANECEVFWLVYCLTEKYLKLFPTVEYGMIK